jgi:hypothetical protein
MKRHPLERIVRLQKQGVETMRFGRVADLAKEHFKWDGFNTPAQPIITANDACIFAEKAVEIET